MRWEWLEEFDDIELLLYSPYPTVVRNVLMETDTVKDEDNALIRFGNTLLYSVLPKYKVPDDNKIAIKFRIKSHTGEKICSLWFGSRDGRYYIGLSAENKDGFTPIVLHKTE
jgi:hypothetical protein